MELNLGRGVMKSVSLYVGLNNSLERAPQPQAPPSPTYQVRVKTTVWKPLRGEAVARAVDCAEDAVLGEDCEAACWRAGPN